MDNRCAPKLNSLIKLHKINKPIRPLINARTDVYKRQVQGKGFGVWGGMLKG